MRLLLPVCHPSSRPAPAREHDILSLGTWPGESVPNQSWAWMNKRASPILNFKKRPTNEEQ